jgi:hypothetical protein
MKIPGLLGMRQKKGRESLDNIDKRAGIYGNLLHKAIPLLLFRRVAGESDVSPSGRSVGILVLRRANVAVMACASRSHLKPYACASIQIS